ncbi:MAG: hypothetical protein RL338_1425 [Chloroflexota bacterium]|jgi:uncharacterized protein (TIRG00374 family)
MSLRGSLLRGLLGIAISIVAIALVLRGVDLAATGEVLASAAPAWLAVLLAVQVTDGLVRGVRWRRLLAPVVALPLGRTLDYLFLGYLANNVLPARLGELVRSHYLGDREGVSRTTTLGTVVVERIVDTGLLVLVAGGTILLLEVTGPVAAAVTVGAALVGLLVAGLLVALVAHRLPGAGVVVEALAHRRRLVGVATSLREGLAVASDARTIGSVLLLSVVAWGASTTAIVVAASSIGLELRPLEAALLMSGAALSTAIPSGPGYVGTYELAMVAVAGAIGIDATSAFALALVVHGAVLLVTTGGGIVGFARAWRRPRAATTGRAT